MKRFRTTIRATLALTVVALVAVLAPGAMAASNAAVGTLPANVPAGATTSTTFTLKTTGGSASSFNLTAPAGFSIQSVDSSSQGGVTLASANQIQGRSITASTSTTLSVSFTVQAPCSAAATAWGLAVKSNPNFNGSTMANDPSSALSTGLSGQCTAAFSRAPADAAFVGTTAPNITSAAYNQSGDSIQVLVKDATGAARPGISVSLNFNANPTNATLTAPTVTSGSDGLASFSPVKISKPGLLYQLVPSATGVSATASGFFGVFQDEQACGSCTAHGNSNTVHSTVTANSTNGGTLAVLVSGVAADQIDCGPTIPSGYDYMPVSSEVTAWQYTGNGAQTVVVDLDRTLIKKILNRGSAHIDFCYQADNGKTFTDKFGQGPTSGPGLLPDCGPGVTNNCIVSETGDGNGGRLITVTVDDGKGRP